jgi:citrate lyase subunit beta/citryl-CoA lyase
MAALSLSVMAARATRIAILDGVFNEIADAEARAPVRAGRRAGFRRQEPDPSQPGRPANAAFTPSADAVAWARTVVAAFDEPEAAGKGVLKVEGGWWSGCTSPRRSG